jgi:hypothetical protein
VSSVWKSGELYPAGLGQGKEAGKDAAAWSLQKADMVSPTRCGDSSKTNAASAHVLKQYPSYMRNGAYGQTTLLASPLYPTLD